MNRILARGAAISATAVRSLVDACRQALCDWVRRFGAANTVSELAEVVVFNVLFPIMLVGLLGYVVAVLPQDRFEPFELAIISVLLGGFALAGGSLERSGSALSLGLRRVGVLYLASAIAFILFGLYVTLGKVAGEGEQPPRITHIIVPSSLMVAASVFAFATAWLAALAPRIWRGEREDGREQSQKRTPRA